MVVGNGAEGEPASGKDQSLLWVSPHLVLDGLQLAAEAVGARRAILPSTRAATPAAGADRGRWPSGRPPGSTGCRWSWSRRPAGFLAGEESALAGASAAAWACPRFKPPRVSERGVGGHPTLVQNVETLAHLALIARYGAAWFRSVGTGAEPGSMLAHGCTRPTAGGVVTEAALGTPLRRAARPARAGAGRAGAAGITARGCRPGRRPGWR